MTDPTKTNAFPSLDAWKRTQQAREDTLEFLYKATLKDIQATASRGQTTIQLNLGTRDMEFTRSGWWIFSKHRPTGRLKRLIEKFETDGFSVQFDHDRSALQISWNLE